MPDDGLVVNSPMCGLSRLVLVALAIGLVVSSLSGSDLAGWLAALAGVAALAAVRRVRGTVTACPVPVPARTDDRAARPKEHR